MEKLKVVIDAFFDEWECPSNKVYSKDLAEYLDKAIGIDEDKIYKFLRSIKGCNTEWIDSDWADCVNVKDLAQAITQSRPLKCEVGEYVQPCSHRPDCTCQYCD